MGRLGNNMTSGETEIRMQRELVGSSDTDFCRAAVTLNALGMNLSAETQN